MCGGKLSPFLAKLATYARYVFAANGHIMTRNEPTVDVWWKYTSISDQISHLQQVCGGNTWPFPAKLVTYNRCVVEILGHFWPN